MSGNVGDAGYYVCIDNDLGRICYGPFKTKEVTEFFNFVAFCSPRSLDAAQDAQSGILYCKGNESCTFEHPSSMFATNSHFSLWWEDLYGISLTAKMILQVAKESGAKGYDAFTQWLIDGSRIDGKHLAAAY